MRNNKMKLLSRDKFRESVFKRDGYKCIFCKNSAVDAHHIIERRLWPDGGYYEDNGVSVCEEHHLQCEKTTISVEEVRAKAGVKKIIPPHLYDDEIYDKWGNIILPNKQRLKGELFHDESVQLILKAGNVLSLFTNIVKYPRTYHLPWSDNVSDDDRVLNDLSNFVGNEVIVTEKMDGENSTLYNDYIHARSVDGRNHPTRNWLKNYWSQIKNEIPENYRICGENLYAKHSIYYDALPSYFMGFSIWTDKNLCLSWNETVEWFSLLNIQSVPVLYDGIFDENIIKKLMDTKDLTKTEGYVLRNKKSFTYAEFRYNVAKYVRKNHIQTVKHWMHGQPIEKNNLIYV